VYGGQITYLGNEKYIYPKVKGAYDLAKMAKREIKLTNHKPAPSFAPQLYTQTPEFKALQARTEIEHKGDKWNKMLGRESKLMMGQNSPTSNATLQPQNAFEELLSASNLYDLHH
jgi:hypothetical protein